MATRSVTTPSGYVSRRSPEEQSYIGGTFSHAIRKGALLARGEGVSQTRDSRESITPREPTSFQHELAEPSLFLQHGIGAAERLAKAMTA